MKKVKEKVRHIGLVALCPACREDFIAAIWQACRL